MGDAKWLVATVRKQGYRALAALRALLDGRLVKLQSARADTFVRRWLNVITLIMRTGNQAIKRCEHVENDLAHER